MLFTNHILSLVSLFLVGVSIITASNEPQQDGLLSSTSKRDSCPGLTPSLNNTTWWRAEIEHNGTTPYSRDSTYKYYRTVTEYGADPTGIKDSSDAFNDAIASPIRTNATTHPAYIYIPPGIYLLKKPISLLLSTFLVGDPLNPPQLVAHPSLLTTGTPAVVINAHLSYLEPNAATKTFYIAVRNLVADTTGIDRREEVVGVDWSVSQGCGLGNVRFVMPGGGEGNTNRHVGVGMGEVGSGLVVGDCTFTGGGVGIQVRSQNYLFKGLVFDGCRVGISVVLSYVSVVQSCVFRNCQYGVDVGAAGGDGVGAVSVVDSTVEGCVAGVRVRAEVGDEGASVVLDNFEVTDSKGVVSLSGDVLLDGGVAAEETWVLGKINPGGYQSGKFIPTRRPEGLLLDGKYFTIPLPQYEEYAVDQFVNIRGDSEFRVYGDNSQDDGPAINTLLQRYAGCKIIFFPQGIYQTNETIYIPPGSRIVGEAMSVISGAGSHFADAGNPQPVVKVGNSGEKGVAQLTDIVVSVAEMLPGAILVQVNMAGEKPGDVGLWNCVFRVGGTVDTLINCPDPDPAGCKAAFALAHITETASVYLESAWGWVADHNMDDMTRAQNIAVGRGVLVESRSPTWFIGSSFEHCVMYQYAFNQASNVYMALQQTESPYWQGDGTRRRAPSPWEANTDFNDPTFDNCASQGQFNNDMCYRSWAVHMSGSNNVVIHGSALWTFFNNMNDNSYEHGECDTTGGICQLNMAYIDGAKSTYWYSASTKAATNMIYDMTGGGGVNLTTQADYGGGWGGVVAAYLRDINLPSIEDGGGNESGSGNQSTSGHQNTGGRMSGMGMPMISLLSFIFFLI